MKLLTEGGKYIVTFDPLDGSSIIGSNFCVGTIVAIWPHDDKYPYSHKLDSLLVKREVIK